MVQINLNQFYLTDLYMPREYMYVCLCENVININMCTLSAHRNKCNDQKLTEKKLTQSITIPNSRKLNFISKSNQMEKLCRLLLKSKKHEECVVSLIHSICFRCVLFTCMCIRSIWHNMYCN